MYFRARDVEHISGCVALRQFAEQPDIRSESFQQHTGQTTTR